MRKKILLLLSFLLIPILTFSQSRITGPGSVSGPVSIVSVSTSPSGPSVGWTQLSAGTTGKDTSLQSGSRNICPPTGTGDGITGLCSQVYYAWSGGAADTKRNRLLINGGGHTDYDGNEWYALDLNASPPALVRLNNPTRNTDPPGGTILCQDAIPGSPSGAQAKKSSRHTRDGLLYNASNDTIYSMGGSLPTDTVCSSLIDVDVWDLSASTMNVSGREDQTSCTGSNGCLTSTGTPWTLLETSAQAQADGLSTAFEKDYAYDPNTNSIFAINANDGSGKFYQFNLSTNRYTLLNNTEVGSDCQNTGTWTVIDPVNKQFIFGAGDCLRSIDISGGTPSYQSIDRRTASGCGSLINNYNGATYDTVYGEIVVYPNTGNAVTLVNTSTWTCTQKAFGSTSGVDFPATDNNSAGTFGRFQYFPLLDEFALCPSPVGNCWTLKLPQPNGFASRIAGTNVPGGSASIVSNQPFETALPTCSPVECDTWTAGAQATVHHFSESTPSIDTTVKADGNSSLKFTIVNGSFQGDSGWYDWNFKTPGTASGLFGNGQEFFIQYKIRLGTGMSGKFSNGGGIKHDITTQGDSATAQANDCGDSPTEVVTVQDQNAAFDGPEVYVNCNGAGSGPLFLQGKATEIVLGGIANSNFLDQDAGGCPHYSGRGIPLNDPTCFNYVENEWFTVQKHIKIGAFGSTNSVVEQWFAHANNPSVLATNASDAALLNTGGSLTNEYGKISLTPYDTSATFNVDSAVWYDDLIISTRRIPDPDVGSPNAPDSLSLTVATGHITVNWRVNSQNSTAQDDTGFLVERCTGATVTCFPNPQSGFSQIGSTGAGASSYQDNTTSSGTTYTYRVRAKNSVGNSAYTVAICFNGGATCGGTAVAQ